MLRLVRIATVAAALCALLASSASAETTTYSFTGGEQLFTVPAGVTSLQVVATGAPGGYSDLGGPAAQVTGMIAVTPGQVLYIEVGGAGGRATSGFNGGGAGLLGTDQDGSGDSGGGGGATDVRTLPRDQGTPSLESRLVVAGGGGGQGSPGVSSMASYAGGEAGAAGEGGAAAGGGGSETDGGTAGSDGVVAGEQGEFGTGGDGSGGGNRNGGGGGGGVYGGGGASRSLDGLGGAGGGGGGSKVPAGGSLSIVSLTTPPQVQLTWTVPTPTPTPTPTPPATDTVSPRLSSLALVPARFQAANSGPSLIAAVGTRVIYRLSEASTVTFRVERAAQGRRRGRRCVPRGRGRRCTRYVRVRGSFRHSGATGPNAFRFMGRINRRALRPGRYRLVAVATDAAGNRSPAGTARFRIVR